MAILFNIKVVGTEKVVKALNPDRAVAALQKALSDAAMLVLRAAKQNAGGAVLKRRTGDLMTDAGAEVDRMALRAKIGSSLVYGPVHEYGATIRPLPPRKYLKFQIAPRGVNVTKGGDFPWVSVRHVIIPKRPWLLPAYEDNKEQIVGAFRGGLERSLMP